MKHPSIRRRPRSVSTLLAVVLSAACADSGDEGTGTTTASGEDAGDGDAGSGGSTGGSSTTSTTGTSTTSGSTTSSTTTTTSSTTTGAEAGETTGVSTDEGGEGGGFDPGPLPRPLDAAEFCTLQAAIFCNGEQVCCTDAAKMWPDQESCVTGTQATTDLCVAAGNNPGTAYDRDAAGVLLDELYRRSMACELDVTDFYLSETGSIRVFPGTKELDGDCTPANETDTNALTCKAPLTCLISLSPSLTLQGRCGTPVAEGGDCFWDPACARGLWCDYVDGSMSPFPGKCRAAQAEDAPCTADGECTTLVCETAMCDVKTPDNVYCSGGMTMP